MRCSRRSDTPGKASPISPTSNRVTGVTAIVFTDAAIDDSGATVICESRRSAVGGRRSALEATQTSTRRLQRGERRQDQMAEEEAVDVWTAFMMRSNP